MPMKLLQNDLFKIKDKAARRKGAVKVLEDLGYAVTLTPAQKKPPTPTHPKLELVHDSTDKKQ